MPRNGSVQRRGLRLHANVAAPHPAKADQFAGDKLCRIDGNGKAQPLRRQDRGGIDAYYFAGEFTSGPPELPGFSAASVWITSSIRRPDCDRRLRPSALTTPAVTVY